MGERGPGWVRALVVLSSVTLVALVVLRAQGCAARGPQAAPSATAEPARSSADAAAPPSDEAGVPASASARAAEPSGSLEPTAGPAVAPAGRQDVVFPATKAGVFLVEPAPPASSGPR